jgi:MFS family permease
MVALVILLVGQAMTVMDGSILVVAAPSLRTNLHASGAEMQLVVAVYALAFAALVGTGARLGDVLGRRRAFALGLAAFTVASLLVGLAPTPDVLIGAQALQGAAAALMTAQVLSIIQARFEGEQRARAIGGYSMILAVGVAAGQVVGGLLIGAHLLAAAWRPALLLNVPIGVALLVASRRGLPPMAPTAERLDLGGVALLAGSLVALIVPLTFGRQYHWPAWVWPCFILSMLGTYAFAAHEQRVRARGGHPVFDPGLLTLPGVAAGVASVLLITACYAGFLLSLTLHLQGALGFSALHAGLIFAIYASGFATASLTWTRAREPARARLPIIGPLVMGTALLAVVLIARRGGWPTAASAPLLFAAGAGHTLGFSPLTNRLSNAIQPAQAADLSGLILTSTFIGQVAGVTVFVGIYLGAAKQGSAHALAIATAALASVLIIAAASARIALTRTAAARARTAQANG